MASIDELLTHVPMSAIAQRLGVDEATARSAAQAAVPTLLGGMHANLAQTEGGEESMSKDLTGHAQLLDHDVTMDAVDAADGDKIVHNLFGDNTEQVAHALGSAPETGPAVNDRLIANVLPMLAPIVMAYVAKQMAGRLGGKASGGGTEQAAGGGGGLGDLLGGLLGGNKAGGGLGEMLGGLLGGGKAGGLGSMLGGLLGGKR